MREILGEQSVAMVGHLRDKNFIRAKSYDVLRSDWSTLDFAEFNGINYEIVKHNTTNTYEVGKVNEVNEKKIFDVIFRIELEDMSKVAKLLGYTNLYQVHMVQVITNERGQNIAKTMYRYLCKTLKINLLGDAYQYFGARKLWVSLSKDTDIQVDIVELQTNKVLFTNVTLHHGKYDEDFDKRLWSYSEDKKQIRSILVNI